MLIAQSNRKPLFSFVGRLSPRPSTELPRGQALSRSKRGTISCTPKPFMTFPKLPSLREIGGRCDHHTSQPCYTQCLLRPLCRPRLVLGQRDAPRGTDPGLQGHRLPIDAQHQRYRGELMAALGLATPHILGGLPSCVRGFAVGSRGINPQGGSYHTPRIRRPGIIL